MPSNVREKAGPSKTLGEGIKRKGSGPMLGDDAVEDAGEETVEGEVLESVMV